jgi:IS5 family transposase
LVSYHDQDARPIAKGRIGRPVELGYKAQIVDNADGVIVEYEVMVGNPSDGPLLAPAIKRLKGRFGRVPKTVTADRGYGDAQVEPELEMLGVKTVVIPGRGRPKRGAAQTATFCPVHQAGQVAPTKLPRSGCDGSASMTRSPPASVLTTGPTCAGQRWSLR